MEPLVEPRALEDDVIDRMTGESLELLKSVVATDVCGDPQEETKNGEEPEQDEALQAHEDVAAMMDVCRRLSDKAAAEAIREMADAERRSSVQATTTTEFERERVVVVAEVDGSAPSWVETKVGPWAVRHQRALRGWLLLLLALYVALFASMLLQHGVHGLSERSTAAAMRDLLWVVLMAIVVLLALAKQY